MKARVINQKCVFLDSVIYSLNILLKNKSWFSQLNVSHLNMKIFAFDMTFVLGKPCSRDYRMLQFIVGIVFSYLYRLLMSK